MTLIKKQQEQKQGDTMNLTKRHKLKCFSSITLIIANSIPWQTANAVDNSNSIIPNHWLNDLPDWSIILGLIGLTVCLSIIGLKLYRNAHQSSGQPTLAYASAVIGGSILGILIALLGTSSWKSYLYEDLSQLPPPAAGIQPQKGPMSLLTDADPEGAAMKPNFPKKTLPSKARHAKVNFNALSADELVLNLFDDMEVIAIRDRVVENLQGGAIWVGHIEDEPDSQVTLAAKGQTLMGTVEWRNRVFEIVYVNGTTHAVRENDPNKIPAEFEPEDISKESPRTSAGDLATASAGSIASGDLTSTGQVIDIMVAYTPKARTNAGGVNGIETKILNAVTRANQSYLNSQINMQLNLVKMVETNYIETGNMIDALTRIQGTSDGYMDEIHSLRNQYAADQVVLVDADSNYCGYANIMTSVSTGFASSAFAVVHDDSVYNCIGSYDSFAHELGHNQGNVHNKENASFAGAYSDSYGYRVCGAYRDIMSYNCSGEPRIPYFSNPNVLYNGQPTGLIGFNDTARSMNATSATVASFRTLVTTAPNAPSNLVVSATSTTSISLKWTDNASNEAGYYLQRSLDGVNWTLIATLGSNVTSFTNSGLNADTTYFYQAYAFNSIGNSAFSNSASAKTNAVVLKVADTTPPSVIISNPVANMKVGTPNQAISVSASDNIAVSSLKLFINNKLVSSGNSSTLNYNWNTRKVASGNHTINAQASDASGNTSSQSVVVVK
jgi:peptidyl-Asp metalloendopeptidase